MVEYVSELGVTSLTVIETLTLTEPPVFEAVMLYAEVPVMLVGVPEITPVDVESASPAGRAGEMEYAVMVPPNALGEFDAIAIFFV